MVINCWNVPILRQFTCEIWKFIFGFLGEHSEKLFEMQNQEKTGSNHQEKRFDMKVSYVKNFNL